MTGTDHWARATAGLPAPLVAVDLDAFDANADDLVRRAGGLPVRVASKSVRCRTLLDRVLARPGFAGVMAYAVPEAVWLVGAGVRDVFVAYPSVDEAALRAVATDDLLRAEVTVTVDSVEHVRWLRDTLGADVAGLGVALDCDASLRVGRVHLGVRRSPTRTPEQALAVVRAALGVGLDVRGVMFYDAQVAGLPDAGPHIRALKRRSVRELRERAPGGRRGGARRDRPALRQRGRHGQPAPVRRRPGGHRAGRRLGPVRPDPLRRLRRPRPAPGDGLRPAGRAPTGPGLRHGVRRRLRRERGAGVVAGAARRCAAGCRWCAPRRPARCRPRCTAPTPTALRIGDRVWMRGAKAGELLERFDVVHLVAGGELVATVPSYRGEGRNFG